MSRIGDFYFDDDEATFVFGNEENGIRISADTITFIQNGQRMSFDEMIKQVSSIEWAPVVHGRWIEKQGGFWETATCSNCEGKYPTVGITPRYCPNCGTRMDLEV